MERRPTLPVLCIVVALLLAACGKGPDKRLLSPDGKLALQFHLMDGMPHYSLSYNDSLLIHPSRLGFVLKDGRNLGEGFELVDSTVTSFQEKYDLPWGEFDSVEDHHRELVIRLRQKNGLKQEMNIVFRAFNDGVAFRYEIPGQDSIFIQDELTGYRFAGNYTTWSLPLDHETYEHLYRVKKLDSLEGGNTPLTLRAHGHVHMSLHEAALYDFPEMALRRDSIHPWTLRADLAAWPDGLKARVKLPFRSPWRTIQVAPTAGKLLESTMILNLNEPNKLPNADWLKPTKYVGIWWGMHIGKNTWAQGDKHGATTAETKRYIDFADSAGIPAVLVEGWNTGWERWGQVGAYDQVTPYPDFDLVGLAKYAQEKGVALVGHHETGGDVLGYDKMLDSAFALYASLGIRAVKTGYAGKIRPEGHVHHNQWMVRHYQKVVEVAAKYKIMIDAHEPIKDTGIRRTWPNFMTREGVRGMEWNAWSEGNPPSHTCILPFTRMLSGPLDYTPGIFQMTYQPWKDGYRVPSTRTRQLAEMIILYSPFQMAADLIENYQNQPEWDFIRRMPCDWDAVYSQNEDMGEYAVVARRDGKDWWLGVANDEKARLLTVKTDFLKAGQDYVVEIWEDGPQAAWYHDQKNAQHAYYHVKKGDPIQLALPGGGGAAMCFREAQDVPNQGPRPLSSRSGLEEKVTGYQKDRVFGKPIQVLHDGMNAQVSAEDSASTKYMKGDLKVLTDGVFAEEFPQDKGWIGWEGNDINLTISLKNQIVLKDITLSFLRNYGSGIFLPTHFKIEASADHIHRELVFDGKVEGNTDAWREGPKVVAYRFQPTKPIFHAQFVHISITSPKIAPAWHWHKGKPVWLFLSEVAINAGAAVNFSEVKVYP